MCIPLPLMNSRLLDQLDQILELSTDKKNLNNTVTVPFSGKHLSYLEEIPLS